MFSNYFPKNLILLFIFIAYLLSCTPPVSSGSSKEKITKMKMGGFDFGNLSNAYPGDSCDPELYQKLSPVSKSNFYENGEEFNKAFQKFIDKLKEPMAEFGEDDVCFHKSMFLECGFENQTCKCAKGGRWKSFKYVHRGMECLVGKGGRCNPNIPKLKCDHNLTCKQTNRHYHSEKYVYLCSGVDGNGFFIRILFPLIIIGGLVVSRSVI